MSEEFKAGQQDVLIAIAEFFGNGGELNADNFEAFVATFDLPAGE